MIELKLNKRILLVEVVGKMPLRVEVGKLCYGSRRHGVFSITLPPDNWSQPIKASEVTEEMAKDIMGSRDIKGDPQDWDDSMYLTYAQLFLSLLIEHKLQPSKTILLIEK